MEELYLRTRVENYMSSPLQTEVSPPNRLQVTPPKMFTNKRGAPQLESRPESFCIGFADLHLLFFFCHETVKCSFTALDTKTS
jgi:hypothetical protein